MPNKVRRLKTYKYRLLFAIPKPTPPIALPNKRLTHIIRFNMFA